MSGEIPSEFAPIPLRVLIMTDPDGILLFESDILGREEIFEAFKSDRLWYLALNLYSLSKSVDSDVPKAEKEVVRVIFDVPVPEEFSASTFHLTQFGVSHLPMMAGRLSLGMLCSRNVVDFNNEKELKKLKEKTALNLLKPSSTFSTPLQIESHDLNPSKIASKHVSTASTVSLSSNAPPSHHTPSTIPSLLPPPSSSVSSTFTPNSLISDISLMSANSALSSLSTASKFGLNSITLPSVPNIFQLISFSANASDEEIFRRNTASITKLNYLFETNRADLSLEKGSINVVCFVIHDNALCGVLLKSFFFFF
jgi:hypothetical protein